MTEQKADQAAVRLNTVIFATDFTVYSQNAGLYAALMARFCSAKLLVAHAFVISQAAMEVEIDGALVSQQRKDLQLLLARKASTLASGAIQAIPLLLDGDPKEELPRVANQYAPSLLVLGTHGGAWAEREVLGSVAEQVLRTSQWPTMTVGPQVRSATSKTFPFRRILLATDLSDAAARAAVLAVWIGRAMEAEIDVLNVVEHGTVVRPDRLETLRTDFNRALHTVVPEQASDFSNPQTFVEAGNAHQHILKHLKDRSIDLLILGIGKTPHPRWEASTSGAFQLILDAECPVLTATG